MKITLKTLQGKQLPLEIDDSLTIAETKAKIEEVHAMPADRLKLISVGKVLDKQDQTLAQYGVKEGGFLVVMQEKPKTNTAKPEEAKKEETASPAVTIQATGATQAATGQAQPAPVQQTQPAQQPNTTQAQPSAQAQPAMAVDEETVGTLIAISGKERDECVRALQAAFGDPDRAFEYLQTGIPNMAGAGLPQGGMPPMGGQGDVDMYGDEEGEDDGSGLGDLAAFAQNPQFQALRQRIIQNPQFYQEFMTMLQQQQPQLYQVIQQNPMAFMNLIMTGGAGGAAGAQGGMPQGGMPQGGQPGHPNQSVMRVNQEEMEAIQRLMTLGFSQNKAAQAYFACDKNEEFAANFLFEQVGEDDEDAFSQGVAQSTGEVPSTQPAAQQEEPAAQQQQQQPPSEEPSANDNNGNGSNNNNEGGAGEGGQDPEGSAFDQLKRDVKIVGGVLSKRDTEQEVSEMRNDKRRNH